MTGSSGVGKSTLIHVLADLDTDFTGQIECYAERKRIVFQDCWLFSHKTIKQNILYLLPQNPKIIASYKKWLEVCDLKEVEHSYPFQISHGMKQKAAIVRGFIADPDLLFLDEPFSAIDIEATLKIATHIVNNQLGITMLVASHSKLPDQFCAGCFSLNSDRIEKT